MKVGSVGCIGQVVFNGIEQRLYSVKVRNVIRLIEDDGWTLVRTRGSHRQFKHPSKAGVVTISGQPGADIPIGTLKSVLRRAGLQES